MPITATREAATLADLSTREWLVVGRQHLHGSRGLMWLYTLPYAEETALHRGVNNGSVQTVRKREGDVITLFAKLPKPVGRGR